MGSGILITPRLTLWIGNKTSKNNESNPARLNRMAVYNNITFKMASQTIFCEDFVNDFVNEDFVVSIVNRKKSKSRRAGEPVNPRRSPAAAFPQ
jgi:hypothetical protein